MQGRQSSVDREFGR